jgi:hypothetical protein
MRVIQAGDNAAEPSCIGEVSCCFRYGDTPDAILFCWHIHCLTSSGPSVCTSVRDSFSTYHIPSPTGASQILEPHKLKKKPFAHLVMQRLGIEPTS